MTTSTTGFAHHRLDAFHAAMELTIGVERLAAALEMVQCLRLAQADEVYALRQLADRIGAMLTGLIKRQQQADASG